MFQLKLILKESIFNSLTFLTNTGILLEGSPVKARLGILAQMMELEPNKVMGSHKMTFTHHKGI